eukprot:GHVL01010233.1.p1 GENE.GHVL01010233.1~~GHVL01010233.1.p1  ORF type:complete len:266 (+),score=21.93 GHVL01010233.1:117-914(+)
MASYTTVAYRKLSRSVDEFFNGTDEAAAVSTDPLLDFAMRSPDELVSFLKVILFFGALSEGLVSIPSMCFVVQYWASAATCNRPLRHWVLVHCILQLMQIPVRILFFTKLSTFRQNGQSVISCFRRMTSSGAWKTTKWLSLATYAWFIMGVVWVLNTDNCPQIPGLKRLSIAMICCAVARLLTTLVCFHRSFNGRFSQQSPPAARGVETSTIQMIPLVKYTPVASNGDLVDASCCICLLEFQKNCMVRSLPCQHMYHQDCIDKWL